MSSSNVSAIQSGDFSFLEESPLLDHVRSGDIDALINDIRHSGVEFNQHNDNIPILFETIHSGRPEILHYLLDTYKADPESCDPDGDTLLTLAIKKSDDNMVEVLINAGADPNVPSGNSTDCGMSPLHLAVYYRKNTIIDILLLRDHKVDLTIGDANGRTAYHLACRYVYTDILQKLTSASTRRLADTDNEGFTPIDLMAEADLDEAIVFCCNWKSLKQNAPGKRWLRYFWLLVDSIDPIGRCSEAVAADIACGRYCDFMKLTTLSGAENTKHADNFVLNRLKQENIDFVEFLINTGQFNRLFAVVPRIMNGLWNSSSDTGRGLFQFWGKHRQTQSRKLLKQLGVEDQLNCVDLATTKPGTKEITHLVIWAVTSGRHKLAELLLRNMQTDIIPLCLVCAMLMQNILQRELHPELEDEIENAGIRWQKMARDALQASFVEDYSTENYITMFYLKYPHTMFGNNSVYQLAVKANCTLILSLSCCDVLLQETWQRSLATKTPLESALMIFIPFVNVVTTLPYFYKKETEKVPDVDFCANAMNDYLADVKTRKKSSFSNFVPKEHPNFMSYVVGFYRTPFVKLSYVVMTHIVFLIVFAYVILRDLHFWAHYQEGLCILYVVGYAMEELLQMTKKFAKDAINDYFYDKWNIVDLAAILLFFAAIFGRVFVLQNTFTDFKAESYDPYLYFVRVCYIFSFCLFFMRIIFVYQLNNTLGTKLKMISRMITHDLFPFLLVLLVFFFAFAVAVHALLYPNGFNLESDVRMTHGKTMTQLFSYAFFALVGEFQLELLFGENCSPESPDNCPHPVGGRLVAYLMLVVYFIVTNILLLNLLIAMFGKTAEETDEAVDKLAVNLIDKVTLGSEYKMRTDFPPPFNIPLVVYEMGITIGELCKKEDKTEKRKRTEVNATFGTCTNMESSSDSSDCEESSERKHLHDTVDKLLPHEGYLLDFYLIQAAAMRKSRTGLCGTYDTHVSHALKEIKNLLNLQNARLSKIETQLNENHK